MTMTGNGLAKLLEELGELSQVAAKKLAYMHTDEHPDGAGSLATRLEEEMADVRAAIDFCIETHGLNEARINIRQNMKLRRFQEWHEKEDHPL